MHIIIENKKRKNKTTMKNKKLLYLKEKKYQE